MAPTKNSSPNEHIAFTLSSTLNNALSKQPYPTPFKSSKVVLDQISDAVGVAPCQLAIMHASSSALSKTARLYAALYNRHVLHEDRLPLRVSALSNGFQRYGEYDDESFLDTFFTPHVEMAECVTVVTWPPPPQVSTKTLFKCRDVNDCSPSSSSSSPLSAPRETNHSDEEQGSRKCRYENEQTPHVIFIACYPGKDSDASSLESRTLFVTMGSNDILRIFAAGIMKWGVEQDAIKTRTKTHFGLYTISEDSAWDYQSDRRVRKLDSVYMPQELKEDILRDVRKFFSEDTKNWYLKHCVPYRRCYLFFGPPGTGKTSMIKALASDLKRNCCFLSMADTSLTGQSLGIAMRHLPDRPLLVIEDLDVVFSGPGMPKVSISALLNILDGIMSMDGVLTILTTNHVDRLDKAVIRAGRVDKCLYFGMANDDMLQQCFQSFYPHAMQETVKAFVHAVGERPDEETPRSIAKLQELFISMREKTAEACVEGLPLFFSSYRKRDELIHELDEKYRTNNMFS